MPDSVEDEAVRIFVEFDRIDSAIKGKSASSPDNMTLQYKICSR